MKYKLIDKLLDFKESNVIFEDKEVKYIESVDDGWAWIVLIDGEYYRLEQGLPEYEGNIYLQKVEILDNE